MKSNNFFVICLLPLQFTHIYSSTCDVSVSKRNFSANERQKKIWSKTKMMNLLIFIFFGRSFLNFDFVWRILFITWRKNELYHSMQNFVSFINSPRWRVRSSWDESYVNSSQTHPIRVLLESTGYKPNYSQICKFQKMYFFVNLP